MPAAAARCASSRSSQLAVHGPDQSVSEITHKRRLSGSTAVSRASARLRGAGRASDHYGPIVRSRRRKGRHRPDQLVATYAR